MTNEKLLQTWHNVSAEAKALYKEICRRGLQLEAAGIDINRQCQRKWEIETPKASLKLVKPRKKQHTPDDLADFV